MIIDCPRCASPFQAAEGQPQIWCPHCGAEAALPKPGWAGVPAKPARGDRRPPSSVSLPAFPAGSPSLSGVGSSAAKPAAAPGSRPGREPMEWFHCRIRTWLGGGKVLRAYVTPHELIFINMGVSALSVDQHARQMSGAMGGGALPALIATAVAHRQREHFEKLSRALEKATPERLREYIAGDNSCLLLPLNEISDPRIEKSTFWSRLNGPHKALLRFRHVSRGETTLEVFERTDVGKAIAAFAKHFQDGFRIDLNYRDAL